jgi:hypothetical protein
MSQLLIRSVKSRWGVCLHVVAALALVALVGAGLGLTSPAHADERLTVVELYTSQGCPACPAAEEQRRDCAVGDIMCGPEFVTGGRVGVKRDGVDA